MSAERQKMMEDSTTRQRSSQLIWQEAQHQRLFELLDALAGEAELSDVLTELHRYAEDHFALEEAYMEALAFPERAPHFRAHERFRAELAEIDASNISDSALRKMTAMFMREWLTRHIYGIDKALEAFILDSDLK
ncbi:MAG: hemerythrin domain-containing protein [Halioglobus sp.]|nr:hemerythrin domain-containing protein [Halioglobus sp.]